jgi:hypothetical protein
MNRFKFFEADNKETNSQNGIASKPITGLQQEEINPYHVQVFRENEAKYRSEQIVLIKIDGVIDSHVNTKLEYHIKKFISDGKLMVKVSLTDQINTIQPSYLQESLTLMSMIDVIKSNALIVIDSQSGKIKSIANIDEIKANWQQFKADIYANTTFVKSPEMKANITKFVNNVESQMNEESIIQDFQVRPFFDLFFDKYLVSEQLTYNDYTRLYYSQLFDHLPVEFEVKQEIIEESPTLMQVSKNAALNNNNMHLQDFERIYDLKYKPKIGYKFSDYSYEHNTQVSYRLDENLLNDASMSIIEDVKNNIELVVDYNIRRIEL